MIKSKAPSPVAAQDFELATTAAAQAAFTMDPRAEDGTLDSKCGHLSEACSKRENDFPPPQKKIVTAKN